MAGFHTPSDGGRHNELASSIVHAAHGERNAGLDELVELEHDWLVFSCGCVFSSDCLVRELC
jgi:hypothetical protein